MGTLIIGSEGSMGKRYQAILKSIGEPFGGVDVAHSEETISEKIEEADRFILCTPTPVHFAYLEKLIPMGKPILCEKPISKSLREMDKILEMTLKFNIQFSMTFQYSELVPSEQAPGFSEYHYFRSGADGLVWDCLQIIALAQGEIEISNDSPVWKCTINGLKLNLSDMDQAYVSFVSKWLEGRIRQTADYLYRIHEKTERLRNERNSGLN